MIDRIPLLARDFDLPDGNAVITRALKILDVISSIKVERGEVIARFRDGSSVNLA